VKKFRCLGAYLGRRENRRVLGDALICSCVRPFVRRYHQRSVPGGQAPLQRGTNRVDTPESSLPIAFRLLAVRTACTCPIRSSEYVVMLRTFTDCVSQQTFIRKNMSTGDKRRAEGKPQRASATCLPLRGYGVWRNGHARFFAAQLPKPRASFPNRESTRMLKFPGRNK
jgi:hypothetical protein